MADPFQSFSSGEGHTLPNVGRSVFRTQVLLLIAALVAIFLAGGPTEGGMGIFLSLAGILMFLIRPPQTSPWMLWVIGALLVISASLSLLPQGWLWNPGVRAYIRLVSILSLPVSITLDPRATLFWILLFGLSLTIALYSLASPPSAKEMEYLALFAIFGCSLYTLLALEAWQTGWKYPFFEKLSWAQPAFGFFPNRNHTAGFLVTGAILSLGLIHRGMSRGRLFKPFLAACSFSLIVSVLLFTAVSRGGMVFLLAGAFIWVVGLGRYRSRSFLLASVALAFVLLVFFMNSESGLLKRLKQHSFGDHSVSVAAESVVGAPHVPASLNEIRLKIWQDTLSIIMDYPATGTGLGTYPFIYPFYADKSLRDQSTALHAESDWITLCAEEGIPSLILALAGIGFLISKIPHLADQSGPEWPLRWAFIAAFLTELFHGLVDVPLHKPELGWWILLLGGIGFGTPCGKAESRLVSLGIQRAIFLIGGVGALLLGLMMIWAQWGGGAPLPPWAQGVAEKKIVTLYGKGSPEEAQQAIEEARRVIREYPMAHKVYFQLAKMLLNSQKNVFETTQLLEAEQALSPNDPDIVFVGGWMLAEDAPMTTATFWNEAIRRQLAYDDSPNSPIPRTGDLYRQMISIERGNWVLFDRLPAIASNKELRMISLGLPECSALQIAEAVRDADFMGSLTEKEQCQLINLWWQRGERKEVEVFLDAHHEYQEAALGTRLTMLTSRGREEEACQLLIKKFQIPTPELTDQISQEIRSAEGEVPDDPLDAAIFYRNLGNEVAARHYLEEALTGPKKAEALRFRAVLEMRAGVWKDAMRDLTAYLQTIGKI